MMGEGEVEPSFSFEEETWISSLIIKRMVSMEGMGESVKMVVRLGIGCVSDEGMHGCLRRGRYSYKPGHN
jgi:hypothetical protein